MLPMGPNLNFYISLPNFTEVLKIVVPPKAVALPFFGTVRYMDTAEQQICEAEAKRNGPNNAWHGAIGKVRSIFKANLGRYK